MLMDEYFSAMKNVLTKAENTQREAILAAADEIANRLEKGGAWHIMDTGHMLMFEAVGRTGGMMAIKPIKITCEIQNPVRYRPSPARGENVMNPTNLGAIFRSAAALNMDAVLLTEAGSDPLYRRAVRVSMGTVFQIPWTYLPDGWPEPSMGWLRAQGFRTVAMALRDDSVPLNDPRLLAEERLAIVLGTEGDGLAQATIDACDYTVRIPMSHGVDSLNVAAASAVAFYQLGLQ